MVCECFFSLFLLNFYPSHDIILRNIQFGKCDRATFLTFLRTRGQDQKPVLISAPISAKSDKNLSKKPFTSANSSKKTKNVSFFHWNSMKLSNSTPLGSQLMNCLIQTFCGYLEPLFVLKTRYGYIYKITRSAPTDNQIRALQTSCSSYS